MTHHFKKLLFCLVVINYAFSSCTSDTKVFIDKTNKTYDNGITLTVKKKSEITTTTGTITNHVYDVSHHYTYTFNIKNHKINWTGESAEPKNIIFYHDTVYVRYLKEKVITTKHINPSDSTITYKHHTEINEYHQKHIDKRYFFKLFGKDYWTDINTEQYNMIKKLGKEYKIPNDNNLSLNNN